MGDRWANAASDAGMRYVVFTTKHHDGFCMFDTKTTDYKVTAQDRAFQSNPRSNVAREIFDAFRKKGLAAGVYYSKPDWHSPDYWWPYFPTPDRHVNYDPAKYPDRWVNGQYENYLTPENKVPEHALSAPWESCITLATSWSYVKTDKYKSVRELVQLLVDVVAKGGNLLLNIGSSPEGEWAPDAYDRLEGMAAWMKVNKEAIYDTRAIAPYKEGKVCLTRKKEEGAVYAIYLPEPKENRPPRTVVLRGPQPAPEAKVTMLGYDGELKWKPVGDGVLIEIPENVHRTPPCEHSGVSIRGRNLQIA